MIIQDKRDRFTTEYQSDTNDEITYDNGCKNQHEVLYNELKTLRKKLAAVVYNINGHIERTSCHPIATESTPGFMDKATYSNLKDLQNKIDSLVERINNSIIPKGTIVFHRDYNELSSNDMNKWRYCNGEDGTEDLRNSIIMGVDQDNYTTDQSIYASETSTSSTPYVTLNCIESILEDKKLSTDSFKCELIED